MGSIINRNSLMHAVQCVSAISRFMEEHLSSENATEEKRETFGELIMDMDSTLDNLSFVYDEMNENGNLPNSEKLMEACIGYTISRKEGKTD
jgi:hypothetical protein